MTTGTMAGLLNGVEGATVKDYLLTFEVSELDESLEFAVFDTLDALSSHVDGVHLVTMQHESGTAVAAATDKRPTGRAPPGASG